MVGCVGEDDLIEFWDILDVEEIDSLTHVVVGETDGGRVNEEIKGD